MIRVMIVDDHLLFGEALRKMLENEEQIEVTAVASSAMQALKLLEHIRVNMILMDIRMGENEMNGLEAATYISEHFPHVKVLILTMIRKGRYIDQILKQGISGYMLKHTAGIELIEAIKTIQEGGTYFSVEVMKAHMDFIRQTHLEGAASFHLTKREQEILQLLVEGYSTLEIGDKLCIGEAGVETHRRNLRKKLNVKNTAALIREAIIKDLVNIDKYK